MYYSLKANSYNQHKDITNGLNICRLFRTKITTDISRYGFDISSTNQLYSFNFINHSTNTRMYCLMQRWDDM